MGPYYFLTEPAANFKKPFLGGYTIVPLDLADIIMKEDDIFNSHDKVSLLTDTPVDELVKVIRNRLKGDKTVRRKQDVWLHENIIELLELYSTQHIFYRVSRPKLWQLAVRAPIVLFAFKSSQINFSNFDCMQHKFSIK